MENLKSLGEPRRDAVFEALRTTFGAAGHSDFQPISGGVSGAAILGFEVRDRRYVLRVEPERIGLHDVERAYGCMRAAAEAGVAPRLHYADPASGVAIIDFVQSAPLSGYPGGEPGLARGLGKLIQRLQAAPLFPALGDYPEAIAKMLATLRTSPHMGPADFEACSTGLARIRSALRWTPSARVSSHNDPNPRNLLFDGERLWLIDWELGFRNDPMVDVAILAAEVIQSPGGQVVLLETALGVTADAAALARLEVIKLLTRLFYGCIVLEGLGQHFTPGPGARRALSPAGFRRAVSAGRLASGAPETAYAFALMSLAAFAKAATSPRLDEVLRLVG
ncbi:MAG TPA: phosphotransferase [Caulobacteraceae bacterium]